MRVRIRYDTTHANSWGSLQETIGNKTVGVGDSIQWSSDSQYPVVNARYNLADACSNSSLLAQVGDVLSCLANDNASFFGRDDCTKCELSGIIVFSRTWCAVFVHIHAAHRLTDRVDGV